MKSTKLGFLMKDIAVTEQPDTAVDAVVTDSRLVRPGSVFVAIVGERLDGHDFVADAFQKGAVAAVVSKKSEGVTGEQLLVANTMDAHILMAKNYKEQFPSLLSVAVTGSVGKTTTKEMVAAIFSEFGNTLKNEGNLNNEVGLPQTIFMIGDDTELAVFEMGMNNLGDIRKLTGAVQPKAAIITGIGVSHIENLGTRENILKAKLEVVEGIQKGGMLVVNGDDELLMKARKALSVDSVTFAIENSDADVVAKGIMARPQSSEFVIDDRINGEFHAMIPAVGSHNILDAIAAYTLATRVGFDPQRAAAALKNYAPTGMRQHIVSFNGITVIEDCYNANPDSMRAALDALSAVPAEGIRVAVLGDMLELGSISDEEHRKLGIEAARSGIDILLCYGEQMKHAAEAARAARVTSVEWFDDKRELADYLSKTLHAGDAVVFKGSRGMRLEEIIEIFYQH